MKHLTIKALALTGSILVMAPASFAQEKKEALDLPNPPVKPETIQIVYEAFSLPMSEAAALLRSAPADAEFYKKMVDGVRGQKVTQEVFLMGRGVTGQRVIIEHLSPMIYNTEIEPPELPNQVAGGAGLQNNPNGKVEAANFPATPGTPTSFDTRNVGDSAEFELNKNPEGDIELRLNLGKTTFIKRDTWGQGLSTTEMPRFANQQIQSLIVVTPGMTTFVGTLSPPEELQPEKSEDRTWFAFVTAKIINQ